MTKQVLTVAIDDIKPYEGSHKTDSALKSIKESLSQFGFTQPIIIDDNNVIIAGNGLWKAAKELGIKDVPVIVEKDLDEERVNQYRMADNLTGTFATWNENKLKKELSYIDDLGSVQCYFDEDLTKMLGLASAETKKEMAKLKISGSEQEVDGAQIVTNVENVTPVDINEIMEKEQEEKEAKDEKFRKAIKSTESSMTAKPREYFTFKCGHCGRDVTIMKTW